MHNVPNAWIQIVLFIFIVYSKSLVTSIEPFSHLNLFWYPLLNICASFILAGGGRGRISELIKFRGGVFKGSKPSARVAQEKDERQHGKAYKGSKTIRVQQLH